MQVIRTSLPSPVLHSRSRGKTENLVVRCSIKRPASDNGIPKHIFSGLVASCIVFSQANLVYGADLPRRDSIGLLADVSSSTVPFPLDENSNTLADGSRWPLLNVDLLDKARKTVIAPSYSKLFSILVGIYTFDMEAPAIQVDTFCVHGGPDGYITGIRGKVQCLSEEDKELKETALERQEMIKEKCYLRFPTLPFIPKEPYDVIATDYDNYAIVSGAKDKSFVQIYSRTPNPGPEFIEKYKNYLADFGYDPNKIKDTPQDCQVMSNSQLASMMSQSGMQQALTNQFPDLELKSSVAFNPFSSVLETLKKLLELYFK
uniref:Lipocalin/cytosolic fatty-acid binding domain-containing protein n=1 Tax=Chenopodium quinoa TaxID=63459 RepID=A0A803KMX0_CHEQI